MDKLHRELIKSEFSHIDTVFFNTAYFGPSPYRAKQKVSRALQKELDPSFQDYNTWAGIADRLREQIAEFIGAPAKNITHSTSASDVINNIANGFPFKKGDVVCSIKDDYPSNILPWMHAKKTREFDFQMLDLEGELIPSRSWLEKKLPKQTKILNISHVTFETGKRIPLFEIGKLCKERDILFVVDCTQSLGGISLKPEELEVIDIVACASYKWMLGPYGHAFAYFNDEAVAKIKHLNANWLKSPSNKDVRNLLNYSTETYEGATKFDRGQTSNFLTNACMEAGLEIFKEIGPSNIEKHNASVRDYFLNNYPKKKFSLITPVSHMANIICLKAESIDSLDLERELKHRNVDVSVRQGNVRLSFHLFNTTEDVDQLITALDI